MATLPDSASPEIESQDQDAGVSTEALSAPSAPSRRRFFAMGAAVATGAAASIAAGVDAQTTRPRGKPLPTPPPSGGKFDASIAWKDPVLRLVRRITMGLEPSEVALARKLGYAGYLEYQLKAAAIDDSAMDTILAARMPLLTMGSVALRLEDGGEVYNQLADASLHRAAFSKRQLKERMVEFWTDHFNIQYEKVQVFKVVDDRDVIRANALGNFFDMVRASAESPAMLLYLDQNSSRKPTPNQNYAREIMELHTLGVDGGYTQDDVAQLSRILTGWSYNNTTVVFAFNRGFHDFTAKTFMGEAFPAMPSNATAAQMKSEGDRAITMMLNNPATATFIATKMARWLLAYDPPQSVIDATAAAYTATGGDIKAMIRAILTGKNLMAAPAKYKRPFHLAASSLRALSPEVLNIRSTRARLDGMDMRPFYWDQPDGYPDRINWWSGLVSSRWNWATYISGRPANDANIRVDTLGKFRAPVDNADGVIAQINARLFSGEMQSSLRTALTTYLKAGTYNDARVRETIGLALSSHQFQWY